MSFTGKLCNPTPFDVKLNWERGINIRIQAFGETELTMQQLDDFRPGKPGSADVAQTLNYFGLFLLDTDRPYDNQALEALRRSQAAKKAQYDSAVRNITDQRAKAGVAPDADALNETLDLMGYVELGRKISVLKDAVAEFAAVVGDNPEQNIRTQLDPKRTVFVMDPPREFPSVAAMEFFLKQNDDVRIKHSAFNQQAVGAPEAQASAITPTERFVTEELSPQADPASLESM